MYRLYLFALFLICTEEYFAQHRKYSTANAHSHNDYEQKVPFQKAWRNQFGSIEADIFLNRGKLIVAHDSGQLKRQWTLDSLYLAPLQQCINENGRYVYPDKNRSLQLMIDIKSDAVETLNELVETLKSFPSLINCSSLVIVISGNRPPPSEFSSYPPWIRFDGELARDYRLQELEKIEMLSNNFADYSAWKGIGDIPSNDKRVLQQMIDKADKLGKKVRFWNAPDVPNSWRVLMELRVDYINTDKIEALSAFLNK